MYPEFEGYGMTEFITAKGLQHLKGWDLDD
jgi:hypothetical protein